MTRPMRAMRMLQLADGRSVAYDTYGAPDGDPVVWCHGGLSCRLDIAHAHTAARAAGIRIIAPDRPGVGASERVPRLTALGWAADLAEVADRLGFDRFGLLGWSGGTVFAAVAAAHCGDRVHSLGLIAPVAPPHAGLWSRVAFADRALDTIRRRDPQRAAQVLTAMRQLPLDRLLAGVERATLAADPTPGPSVATIYRAATAAGVAGTLADYPVYADDWGVDLTTISARTAVFVGSDDGFAPPAHARWLADAIPQASLTLCGGLGHFMLHARRELVLAAVGHR